MSVSHIISIGRAVGPADQLPADRWWSFRHDLERLCEQHGLATVFTGTGTGKYDGMSEESYTIVCTGDVIEPYYFQRLQALAKEYAQESIAYTIGETQFVTAE